MDFASDRRSILYLVKKGKRFVSQTFGCIRFRRQTIKASDTPLVMLSGIIINTFVISFWLPSNLSLQMCCSVAPVQPICGAQRPHAT